MKAGALRHRVTIQRLQETPDAFGGVGSSWIDVAAVWASVTGVTGRRVGDEKPIGSVVEASTNLVVLMRYRSDVTSKMRLAWGARTLEIVGVEDTEGRRRMLSMVCREVT